MNTMTTSMTWMAMPMLLSLAACAPTGSSAASDPGNAAAGSPPVPAGASPPAAEPASGKPSTLSKPSKSANAPANGAPRASISGEIRDGNRPPPALWVCATPIDGGAPTCVQTAAGAREYRIEVAPGGYYLMGWGGPGAVALIAHASQIRCIRAPCPPDQLIRVDVAPGQHRDRIDLNGAYAAIPDGWPGRPG